MKKIFNAIIMSLILVFSALSVSAARLPNVGEDSNQWGTILNDYLQVSHDENGTLKATLSPTFDGLTLTDRLIIDSPGPTFNGSSSRQTVQADANFDGYTGSSYGAGIMGNALGTLNAGASNSIIAGLIGKYNIDTIGGNAGPKGAVVGEVGEEATGTKANGAFIAVLGGNDPDTGAITPGAAYTVRYLNVNSASKFDYGLDLLGAQISGHQPVTYGTADIRLSNGATIFNNDANTLTVTENNIVLAGNVDLGTGTLTIGEGKLADSTITSADIKDGTIATADIAAGAITGGAGGVISDNSITASDIAPDAVASSEIAADAVGASELADDSVASANIIADTIVAGDIATDAVTTTEILDGTIATADIANDAVTDAKVVDTITASNYLPLAGGTLTGNIEGTVTRATGATGSYQVFAGDLIYEGAAGGTSSYHAGVMGNFLSNDALTNTNPAMHAGVIGKYSVTTSDASAGPQAGLVGEVETSVADAAIMAVLSGDTTPTPNAAYGVQYLVLDSGGKFNYGLDLSHAQTVGLGAATIVSYGTADIRLSTGVLIMSGSGSPEGVKTAPVGSLYTRTDGGASTTLYVKESGTGNTGWKAK